jgi:2-amino-4-hydroxy-6-hydroxymethyldihydropteridine diphosphokinase
VILIALGSNLNSKWGTPSQTLMAAIAEMQRRQIKVRALSTLIGTDPMGPKNQPQYVNAVALIETHKSPEALMRCLHQIEHLAGRKRLRRWGARCLDLDLLDYHGLTRKPAVTSIKPLALPHPGIVMRSFVLEPLAEIAPRWKHPVSHKTPSLMLRKLYGLNRT